ncbi:methyltransferase domain-containing protein [Aquimarina sp. 2201CG5-10]|uniref:methyltransferase domain-containing protein n=1 Tax=Aquimarina callyspongiae TaxID=3098150 RepID=UPI002AB3EA62|nr:methyltransferase domain-containing protein [Aquimarina sp. 2201CG5-10]MDY8136596.1 methyltransferase domain-containing protein [Aquimarina sp. 2201CG5-10]
MNPLIRLQRREQLDNPALSGTRLHKTLGSLQLINTLFGNHAYLGDAVLRYCLSQSPQKSFHIVDLGCGGGDCIHTISSKLKKNGIQARFTGIDGNPESIVYAEKNNKRIETVNYIVDDILNPEFEIPDCDLIISSHFIYHFENQNLIRFLCKLDANKVKHAIFSDLYRSKAAYNLFKIFGYLLPLSSIARQDGLVAIQRAFTIEEFENILQNSKIKTFKIHKKSWFRTITHINV